MKFIVKLHPEIMIKSKSVRKRFGKLLESNIRNVLRKTDESVRVRFNWDHISATSSLDDADNTAKLVVSLRNMPGIHHFLEVRQYNFETIDDIFQHALPVFTERLKGKTFCVRAKRRGKHDFNSLEVERYVGGGLNQHTEAAGVRLKDPDEVIGLEIEDDKLYLVEKRHDGMGGFPIATQEDVLSLISGGFDSGVSSFQCIKRGARTHFCFFNLGGAAHEQGVKQVAYYLWHKYGSSHKVRFISVPFEPVVEEILERVDNGQMGVILKRMMMRVASEVAQRFNIPALVTGEAMGQVSSQTLTNLNVIDKVTDTVILRPLVTWDKQEIIDVARQIGTESFAAAMPEYCGVISQKPTVKAVLSKIEAEEAKFSEDLIERVMAETKVMDIRDVAKEEQARVTEMETVDTPTAGAVVLDIRAPEEEEEKPLLMDGVDVVTLPFFKLGSAFKELDQSRTYLLYCDRGVMSKLQALYLKEQGYDNVKVYRP
ncbi:MULTISPECIES: tRNA uracil 4-sulfurtransferase ThiI [Ferrimonas]|uniref:tRNA uracil 4-sulfurtransferase ThiI n=1 Tax=Ferrimonas TaxID=44011 RepID=UPI00040722E0|nr:MULTISPECIES: tRNA uracil 4-sulfurtransferase ThiI [Ferrimonas]USD38551.1 tRNA 4-thiouridine(8) synthase ThiI [Ferrimonas sp. SCSIO 43195]